MLVTLIGRTVAAGMIALLATQAAAVEWNVSLWGERRASTEHVHRLAELVAEKTDGEFTMNIVYDGLSKSTENLDGISLGAFEMAQFCAGYHADKNPTLTVLELPFLGISTLEDDLAVSWAVYRHPAVKKDLARWKAMILMPAPTPQHTLAGVGEAPDTLEAMKGKRVRAIGGPAEALEAMGAAVMPVTSTEAYSALESGVVDMVAFAPHAHLSFGTIGLSDWWLSNLELGTTNCPVAVSIDAYEALTPELRGALLSSVDEAMRYYLVEYNSLLDDWENTLDQSGVEQVALPEAELERFREVATPIHDRFVERLEAKDLPGRELLDLIQETLAQRRRTSD